MSWTAYDDPVVARKMTSLALQELGRWLVEPEFHEPWNVFCEFMDYLVPQTVPRPSIDGYYNKWSVSLLDVGCAAGYYKPMLRVRYPLLVLSYEGIERSNALHDLAFSLFEIDSYSTLTDMENNPDYGNGQQSFDVVLSGSMLQHEEHWEKALAEQISVCSRWLIIHKIPIADTLIQRQKEAYGVTMNEWNFPVSLIHEKVGRKPVKEHYFASAEPHWSGLYDLEA